MASIIQQIKLWDQLIEQRIKFEELMHKCNSLPQEETWSKLKQIDNDGKLAKYQELAQERLLKLFEECVLFEKSVERLNPGLLEKDRLEEAPEKEQNKRNDKSDDELDGNSEEDEEQMEMESGVSESDLSDEEDDYEEDEEGNQRSFEERPFDESDEETPESDGQGGSLDGKLLQFALDLNNNDLNETLDKTENYLSSRHQRLNAVRNDILNYWFEKTRFTLKGGKLDKSSLDAFEQSTVKSIDHLLLNRLKLVRRTQLKRGNYEIIGKREQSDEPALDSELVERRKKEIYDSEIFDDSDFYHQLLRELVNSLGASNLNNTSKVNPKWLKLMKERFKSNKYVDTKATKARKIRYKVHNELVNFMAPMPHLNRYDDEQHANLCKSVFGNSAPSKTNDDLDFDSSDSD